MENMNRVYDRSMVAGCLSEAGGEFMTIGQMAEKYDLSLRALRFCEDRGLLQPLRQGAVRLYDGKQRQRVEVIIRAKRMGFTLSEIRDLIGDRTRDESPEIETALPPKKIANQIGNLERQRAALDVVIGELRAAYARMAA